MYESQFPIITIKSIEIPVRFLLFSMEQHNLTSQFNFTLWLLLATSYEFVRSHSYNFVRFAFALVTLGLGAGFQYSFYPVIVRFCAIHNVQIHTNKPLLKIVTHSCEIRLAGMLECVCCLKHTGLSRKDFNSTCLYIVIT